MAKNESRPPAAATTEWLDEYKEMVGRLQALSRVAVRQFLGTRPSAAPPLEYLVGRETVLNLSQVQLQVLLTLVAQKLGIPREDFLRVSREELAKQVTLMEEQLCVTGWDHGNPIFDLPAYRERTKLWPG